MGTFVVTGGAGFIGSYLLRRLRREHPAAVLWSADDPSHFSTNPGSRGLAKAGIPCVTPEALLEGLQKGEIRPDGIYHMGASSRTDEIREDFLARVNVGYSQDLWRICTEKGIPLVYASSASTYGAGEKGFSDDPALYGDYRPLNPYGWSKLKFDLWVKEEVAAGRTPPRWAGLRFFNVYGPGESHKGSQASVVHHARKQFLEKGLMKLFRSENPAYADGKQQRDFVFVGDCADVAVACLEGRVKPGIYNVGTGTARTWLDLTEAVAAALDLPHRIEFIDIPTSLRAHYQYFTEAELTRLRAAGYSKPFTDLTEGVRRTFEEDKELA
jgi:ADP-L-glycero-D-manno-heptose 6-epimerase